MFRVTGQSQFLLPIWDFESMTFSGKYILSLARWARRPSGLFMFYRPEFPLKQNTTGMDKASWNNVHWPCKMCSFLLIEDAPENSGGCKEEGWVERVSSGGNHSWYNEQLEDNVRPKRIYQKSFQKVHENDFQTRMASQGTVFQGIAQGDQG